MPWESAEQLNDTPTRWTTIHREARGPGPCCSASWGSRECDGEGVRIPLGAKVEKVKRS